MLGFGFWDFGESWGLTVLGFGFMCGPDQRVDLMKVGIRLPGKGNSNHHGARLVN